MGGLKFCKDCKWSNNSLASHSQGGRHMWWCQHEEFGEGEIDVVTGERRRPVKFCSDVREDEALCGRDARWFEAK